MTRFLLIVLISLFSLGINAQTIHPHKPAPAIKFNKKKHEFKDLIEGKLGECYFYFKNTGTAPLKLTNVKTSCGCTSPSWPRRPIPPGDSASIKVVFNTRGYASKKFAKAIIVTTNVPDKVKNVNKSTHILSIVGNVLSKDALIPQDTTIRLSTYHHHFGDIKRGKKIKFEIEITNSGKDTLVIKGIKKTIAYLQIEGETKPIPPGHTQAIKISFDSDNHKEKEFIAVLRFITNIPAKHTRKISKKGVLISGRIINKKKTSK
jgi:hypothetical protein